ncbi:MAG: hypothetical protein EBE86_033035 [Hormoscilla sp. GUM202]|nr:hypothetical protein [Hormoscilla sp. GUM202]
MSCVPDTEPLYQTIVCFTALLERLNEAAMSPVCRVPRDKSTREISKEWQKPAAAGRHRAGKIGNLTSDFRPSAFDIAVTCWAADWARSCHG